MVELDLLSAQLVAIILESVAYGMFFILFIGCMYSLLCKRRPTKSSTQNQRYRGINWPMLGTTMILFVAITSHWIVDIRRTFLAFIIQKEGPLAYYAKLSDPLDLAQSSLYVFECIVGDSIMVYRLWVVWNQNKAVIILPVLSVLGLIAAGTGITIELHNLKPGEDIFASSSGHFIESAFVLTLLTNVYSTTLISFKIWSVNRVVKRMGRGNLTSVIVIVAESAAVYTAFAFMTLVAYLAKSNLQFAFNCVTSPTIGLVFCLIIVRVTRGMSFGGYDSQTGVGPSIPSWHEGADTNDTTRSQDILRLTPIKVDIQKRVDSDGLNEPALTAQQKGGDLDVSCRHLGNA